MPFLRDGKESGVDVRALKAAPLTNLGCESEFAKFDNRVRASGGSTSIQTHSKKNIIYTNRLLVNSDFTSKSEEDKLQQWSWARKSNETREVRKLQKDFLATVHATKKIALVKKEKLRLEQALKLMKKLDVCKEHGGPVTPSCIELIDRLDNEQLLAEVGYLRLTTAPDIRQMRRVKVDGQLRMLKFSETELRTSIRNSLKPQEDVHSNIEILLNNAL